MATEETKAKYLIVQSKWIRDSTQSGEHIVARSSRKREARGLARHNFNSNLEVVAKHFCYEMEEFEVDEENLSVTLADDKGIYFHSRFFVLEIDD